MEFIENVLENEDKVIVFAHHLEVLHEIYEHFKDKAVILTGESSLKERDEAIQKFQNDPNIRVFVGSIRAAGTGITLTASSTVVFAELDWTPAVMTQAEDRAHRIGQTSEVSIYHIVIDNSIDAYIAEKLIEKQEYMDALLEIQKMAQPVEETINIPVDEATTNNNTNVAKKQVEYVPDDVARPVLEALNILANNDPDLALHRNNIGFNATDSPFGHVLSNLNKLTPKQYEIAKKILRKYSRQIPPELYNRIFPA